MSGDFKILTDAEHIRLRVGMYAGSMAKEQLNGMFFGQYSSRMVIPALLKIIGEIFENSTDEAIRTNFKYGNKIHLDVQNVDEGLEGIKTYVTIKDNGRGIPVEEVDTGSGGKMYRPVAAWTKARAGSNFGENRETIGANGVGSFLTNVLSTEFVGETSDGKKKLKMVCNGMGNVKSVSVSESTEQYTKVTFAPDLDFFGITEIDQDHLDYLKDRLENLSASYPEITFYFNSEKIKFKDVKEYAFKYCTTPIVAKDDKNIIVFGPSGKQEEFLLHSYVNGLWIRNGGTHINFILDKIVESLREHIKKKHKIDVLPASIKQHLTLITVFRGFQNLKFDSQTKERITNSISEISDHLKNFDFDKIARQILGTPEIIDPIIQAILYKKELEDRRELDKKKKLASKKRVVNHISASSTNPEEKILFLAEGLSAIGQLLNVRNPKIHGGYPLRGKVLNVDGMKPLEIMKNKEISELLSIIGLDIGSDPTDLNYGTIGILTDSDTDGSHIFCLLLNLFSLWPNLFTEGRVCRILTPLFVCTKGKDVRWFYTQAEYDAFDSKGYSTEYFKGLGTMTKEMYKKCINEPVMVKIQGDLDVLKMAFGDSTDLRKEWMLK